MRRKGKELENYYYLLSIEFEPSENFSDESIKLLHQKVIYFLLKIEYSPYSLIICQ